MKLFDYAENLMGMNDQVWARHANPWSGWSRLTTLPLIAMAVWSRIWIGWWAAIPLVIFLSWIWINPRLFPLPKRTDNWMSKGVMGERVWLNRRLVPIAKRHADMAIILSVVSGLGAAVYIGGLIWLDVWATLGGMAVSMISKLWFVDRMVWLYEDMAPDHPEYQAWMRR